MKAMRRNGFTLVDALAACAVVGVAAGAAVPALQGQLAKARRGEAIAALTAIEFAQLGHQSRHGAFSADLGALRQPAASAGGHYRLSVRSEGPAVYVAAADAQGAQAGDAACARMTIEMRGEQVSKGPQPACWGP